MNYKVYQGTELKQTVTSKTAVMNGLQPNRTYEFGVEPYNTQTVGGRTRYTHVAYANMKYIALENSSFTLPERSTVRFGADNQWVYKTFDAGTYTASNSTFGGDPYQGVTKHAEVVSDFSVGQGPNKTYIGFYTDFTQTDSTNPLDYAWNTKSTTSVTTRGIRFNIPKTLMVGSTITLRYEEYPLGVVPIGNEPSGMFGGGNKQNLSAKVISMSNGSSVVEVAGNVIDAGNKNLWDRSKAVSGYLNNIADVIRPDAENLVSDFISVDENQTYIYSTEVVLTITNKTQSWDAYVFFDSNKSPLGGRNVQNGPNVTVGTSQHTEWVIKAPIGASFIRIGSRYLQHGTAKLEVGSIATPYASFVDGDTFTVQPDGTCALFSEYKALYY